MLGYVNWRMRVTIADGRVLLGTFMAFDKHMNLVLADTEEYRRVKGKKGNAREERGRVALLLQSRAVWRREKEKEREMAEEAGRPARTLAPPQPQMLLESQPAPLQ